MLSFGPVNNNEPVSTQGDVGLFQHQCQPGWLLNSDPFLFWVGWEGCEQRWFSITSQGSGPVSRRTNTYPSPACLPALSILKRAPRKRRGRVAFDGITVFYFPRCQGFTSVPSRGGCTLGMASRHSACRRFSLAEFTQEQARARQEKLRLRLKEEKLEALRWKVGRPSPWPSPSGCSRVLALGGIRVMLLATLLLVYLGGPWG